VTVPPLVLFSHRVDPAGVLERLRDFGVVSSDADGAAWTSATVRWKSGLFRKHAVTFGHSVDYYSEPGWSRQMIGMMGYFANFPDGEPRDDALTLIKSLQFALSLPDQEFDLNELDRDPRLSVVFAVAKHLDAVLFQPGYLLDSHGRVLLDPDGGTEPGAVLPATARKRGWDRGEDDLGDGNASEVSPPDVDRVVRRAFVLAALSARALTEKDEPDDLEGFRAELNEWLSAVGGDVGLEPDEAAFLANPGVPDDQALVDAVWRVEGLAVLAWALELSDMPRYDELCTPRTLWEALCLFQPEPAQELASRARLRPRAELEAMQRSLLTFHWRIVHYRVQANAIDFQAVVQQGGWFERFDLHSLDLVDGDLALHGTPIADADDEARTSAASIAQERHLAINWLCDGSHRYSDTDTST